MRLSFMETGFLYGTALRAEGLPYGAVAAAVRMLQWAEIHHGLGVAYFERRRREPRRCDPARVRLAADAGGDITVDGGGQSSLIVGPAVLDLATVAAERDGRAAVRVTDVADLGWLGQLADRAAARGFVAALGFAAAPGSADAADLAALYSAGRGIVAVPAMPAPLWAELAATPAAHAPLMAGRAPADPAELARETLTAGEGGAAGFALVCVRADAAVREAVAAAVRAGEGRVLEPEALAEARRRAYIDGMEVDAAAWRSMATHGLTTVVPSTEDSRRQAGADG